MTIANLHLNARPVAVARCPYCHADVTPGEGRVLACESCAAHHHPACWLEGHGCSGCGARARLLRRPRPSTRAPRSTSRGLRAVFVLGLVLGSGFQGLCSLNALGLAAGAWERSQERAFAAACAPIDARFESEIGGLFQAWNALPPLAAEDAREPGDARPLSPAGAARAEQVQALAARTAEAARARAAALAPIEASYGRRDAGRDWRLEELHFIARNSLHAEREMALRALRADKALDADERASREQALARRFAIRASELELQYGGLPAGRRPERWCGTCSHGSWLFWGFSCR